MFQLWWMQINSARNHTTSRRVVQNFFSEPHDEALQSLRQTAVSRRRNIMIDGVESSTCNTTDCLTVIPLVEDMKQLFGRAV
jgi:hypothetical protein